MKRETRVLGRSERRRGTSSLAGGLALLGSVTLSCATAAPASADPDGSVPMRCAYDATTSERPNPLGGRAFVSVRQEGDATVFLYEQLPALVPGGEAVTVSIERTLVVRGRTLEAARAWLRANDDYYDALVGYESREGFTPVDEALTCR